MEKGRKLRRFSRKDYSQIVDFPVEIVGRDGVVRRYTFEDSVRLYQRRISSAGIRYPDDELAGAEVHHCRRRIGQLRRSYFARFGWSGLSVVDAAGGVAGELAAEVAAFLRRWMEGGSVEPESIQFRFLEENEVHQTYFLRRPIPMEDRQGPEAGADYILYLYRFDGGGRCSVREAFFSFLKLLRDAPAGGEGVEDLVAFHHTVDCGLVLTGRGDEPRRAADLLGSAGFEFSPVEEAEDRQPDPIREAGELLRSGERAAALQRFVLAFERNHYRRAAYLGAIAVGDLIGALPEAETAARMATHYFPDDPLLHQHLAVICTRRGAWAEAVVPLERLRSLVGVDAGGDIDLLAAAIDLAMGRSWAAARKLWRAGGPVSGGEPESARLRAWLRFNLARRAGVATGAAASAGLGILALLIGSPASAFLAALAGLLALALGRRADQEQLRRLARADAGLVRLANPASFDSPLGARGTQ